MQNRTDLALEAAELYRETHDDGLADAHTEQWQDGTVTFTKLDVDEALSAVLGKPCGTYLTAAFPPLSDNDSHFEAMASGIGAQLAALLPASGTVLVVGLGNRRITPDALGPQCTSHILATRHIEEEFARSVGLEHLRPTAVIAPDVLGNTGVESAELVAGICHTVQPAAVIAIDALASRSVSRLGCTLQLCDAGIAPGAGVGNNRKALNRETLGIPVIGIGVPTVVDAETIAKELTGDETVSSHGKAMMVTPREIDLIIARAARLIALCVHAALQPDFSPAELSAVASE